jgi:hypothetical protein
MDQQYAVFLEDGFQILKIIELEIEIKDKQLNRVVLGPGVNELKHSPGVAKRFGGVFWIPKDYWDQLNPTKVTLKLI